MREGIEAAQGDVVLRLSGMCGLRLNGDEVEFPGFNRFKESTKGQCDVCRLAESRYQGEHIPRRASGTEQRMARGNVTEGQTSCHATLLPTRVS